MPVPTAYEHEHEHDSVKDEANDTEKAIDVEARLAAADCMILYIGSPIYTNLETLPFEDYIKDRSYCIEQNHAIAQLIRKGTYIKWTIVNSVDAQDALRISAMKYATGYQANFGQLLRSKDGLNSCRRVKTKVTFPNRVSMVAFDGIVAAGKTSTLKRLEHSNRESGRIIVIKEPTREIYGAIKGAIEQGMAKPERQKLIEKVVTRYEMDQLKRLTRRVSELAGSTHYTICIERNWAYADWVFGVKSMPYPCPNYSIADAILSTGITDFSTILLEVEPCNGYKRMIARGKGDDVTLKDQEDMHNRLHLLFSGPYRWAYAARAGDIDGLQFV